LEHRVGGLEKNTAGVISSDPENHAKMVAERAAKVARLANYLPEQKVLGEENADVLIVGWGGTFGHLYTALHELQGEGKSVALCHFDFINPLPKNTADIFARYKKILVCELNSGQFADYLRAKLPQRREVQVNRAFSQLTAARRAQTRLTAAGQQRPHEDHGRAHFQHQLVRDGAARDAVCINGNLVVPLLRLTAQVAQDAQRGVDVPQPGYIVELRFRRAQDGRRQNRERGVFRALHTAHAVQPASASDVP
jgi:hypothetical protein